MYMNISFMVPVWREFICVENYHFILHFSSKRWFFMTISDTDPICQVNRYGSGSKWVNNSFWSGRIRIRNTAEKITRVIYTLLAEKVYLRRYRYLSTVAQHLNISYICTEVPSRC